MFVAHPSTHHSPFKSKSSSKRKHAEMDVEDKHIVHKYVNEQGEHEERKMSVNCLLNTPQELVNIKTNGLHNSSNEISRLSDSKHDKTTYDDQYIEYVEGSPPTTPTYPYYNRVNATVPQRAPCSVCKSETGRCHASDPGRFDGVLNVADWLCMKCYSKWYNRCKRKASSALNLNVVDASIPMPTKRKRREREKDGYQNVPKVESDKKDSDRDTDSDDALLLARIGGNYPTVPPSISSDENADLESASVEELRTEVVKLRKEMRQMVSDIANRDEQVEGMMSFVRNEVALMHSLLKDIHSSKWSNPNLLPNPNPNPNSSSSVSSSSSSSSSLSSSSSSIGAPSSATNHLPSLTSLPSIPLSFSVPGLHS